MPSPLLSFCIPTFNRGRYLSSLLASLAEHLAAFPYSFEIVVADNASTDNTAAVVEGFMARLPLRYIRHAENIGGFPNFQFVMGQAAGRYAMYVADDDSIMAVHVAAAVAKMEADPGIAVVYAPWLLFDLVAKKNLGLFYQVPHDLHIRRGQHRELLEHLLAHHIFPEIQIVRREVLQRLMPRINEHAFFAFVHAADYLALGDIVVQQQPFYASITHYFADDVREQIGNQEAEYAWDRYRGGLEYVMARAGPLSPEDRTRLDAGVQHMIAARMAVAIRLRYAGRKNPVDTYLIAMRLHGMGHGHLSPVPLPHLAAQAAWYFGVTDPDLQRGMRQILCVGPFTPDLQDFLRLHAKLSLVFSTEALALHTLSHTLVLLRGDGGQASGLDAVRQVRVLSESDLMGRFAP